MNGCAFESVPRVIACFPLYDWVLAILGKGC